LLRVREFLASGPAGEDYLSNLISLSVEAVFERQVPAAVVVRTRSGYTARSIARFRLPVWVFGVSTDESTCQQLQFSYGVQPMHVAEYPHDWKPLSRQLLRQHGVVGNLVALASSLSEQESQLGLVHL
jgi:pyruvate kinase